MIKMLRPDKPSILTAVKEQELIDEYKDTGKAVWREPSIVYTLSMMSNEKCSYCETKLDTQARPLHVDHFHCKDKYANEVVSWENLLPSCSQCNSNKGTIDTYVDQIIDPTVDNPKEYLYLKHFMIRSKDNALNSKGRFTVDQLDLNNRKRLLNPRLEIAEKMNFKLTSIHEKAIALKARTDGKLYNKSYIVNGIRDILEMAQPDAEYSAFMATIILDDEDYIETKEILENMHFWNSDLAILEDCAQKIKFDTTL